MSPQNIMVSFEGEVKIIDFGIAKAETQIEETKAGTLKGKFGYMSPEQADGMSVDLRTDIFSLGIVLWELLAYDRLFTASNEAAILRKIRECQIPSIRKINPSVPPELERIVNKALQKDKGLRYQTAAAMHRDLNRFLNTQYPEFTPHDFSVFVKNTFVNSYQDQKRKLVEFSKIQSDNIPQSTKIAAPMPPPSSIPKDDMNDIPSPPPMPEGFDSMPTVVALPPGEKILTKIPRSGTVKSDTISMANSPPPTPPSPHSAGSASSTSKSESRIIKGYRQKKEFSAYPIAVGLFLLAIGGSIYFVIESQPQFFTASYWMSQPAQGGKPRPSDSTRPSAAPNLSGETHEASKAEYFMTVYSNPSGAEVKVNGRSTGLITPAQIRVEGNKQAHLTLAKDGYITYELDLKVTQDGTTHQATLQPLPKAGYLSVTLVQGGQNPIIEINGQRLGEKPPIVNYRVPAGVPVTIKARNPFTGAYAEQTLTVGNNQKKSIELILK
jgi:serine/threonine-protein kinase